MSVPDTRVMDALMALDPGDDVTLTVQQDGEEQRILAGVTDAYREPPEVSGGVPVKGELIIHMDAANDAVERLDLPSHSLAIHAADRRPGQWTRCGLTVWEPVESDEEPGLIVDDEYRDLGLITAVEVARED